MHVAGRERWKLVSLARYRRRRRARAQGRKEPLPCARAPKGEKRRNGPQRGRGETSFLEEVCHKSQKAQFENQIDNKRIMAVQNCGDKDD